MKYIKILNHIIHYNNIFSESDFKSRKYYSDIYE